MTAVPTALEAHERVGGHAATHQSVLARSVIASYTRPTPIEIPILLNLQVLLPLLALGGVLAVTLVKALDALLLGERYAHSMGVSVQRVRWLALASVALLSGTTTAFCGIVAFLDVAVPQVARGVMQSAQHRVLLPASLLIGAAVAMFADLLAHLPAGNKVLHLNAITAILGAPVVIWIVLRGTRRADGGES